MSAPSQGPTTPAIYYDPRWYASAGLYATPNGQNSAPTSSQYPYYYPSAPQYPTYASQDYFGAGPSEKLPRTSTLPPSAASGKPVMKRAKTLAAGLLPRSKTSHNAAATQVNTQYSVPLQQPQPYVAHVPYTYYYNYPVVPPAPSATQPQIPPAPTAPAPKVEPAGPPIVTVTPPEENADTPHRRGSSVSSNDVRPESPIVPLQPNDGPPPTVNVQIHDTPDEGWSGSQSTISPAKVALPLSPAPGHGYSMASPSSDPHQMPSISEAMGALTYSAEPSDDLIRSDPKGFLASLEGPSFVDMLKDENEDETPYIDDSLPPRIRETVAAARQAPPDLPNWMKPKPSQPPVTTRSHRTRSDSGPVFPIPPPHPPAEQDPRAAQPMKRSRTLPYAVAPGGPPLMYQPPPPPIFVPQQPAPAPVSAKSKFIPRFMRRKPAPPIPPVKVQPPIIPIIPSLPKKKSKKSKMYTEADRPPSLSTSEVTDSTGTVPTPTSARFPSPTTATSTSSKRSRPPQILTFNSPNESHFGFSNTAPYKVYYGRKLYPTADHLFHALKFLPPKPSGLGSAFGGMIGSTPGAGNGARIAEQVRNAGPEAIHAWIEARRNSQFQRKDWDDVKLEKMEEVLYHKFTQHEDLLHELIETYPAQLVYSSKQDSFFGVGPSGQGSNELGKLLMSIRERLMYNGEP